MKKYIVAIDQSTSASKVFLADGNGTIVRRFSKPHRQYYPAPGLAEHDAEEIWQNVLEGMSEVTRDIDKEEIAAVSVCNQRETTAFWSRKDGCALRRAIVWQDVRAHELCGELAASAEEVKRASGIALSPYYSAAKAAHALREDPSLLARAKDGEALIGTIDSFLIYKLTGGQTFATDVSNASRTQLFNIRRLSFDGDLCALFGVPPKCLPRPLMSDADFGTVAAPEKLKGVPVTGVMGDSHSSLFAQKCLYEGMTKTSYGTGSSVMMNTGTQACESKNGLSTSIAYGFRGQVKYVLEGNITHSGDTLKWLVEQAQMASSVAEVEQIALSVKDSGGVYLVPAFSGMGAPDFDETARGAFIGLSRASTRAHMVRAALESMAYQNAAVINAMQADAGAHIAVLHADGGGCKNETLMQLQADLLGCPLEAGDETELSALGCALMAAEKTLGTDAEKQRVGKTRLYEPGISERERLSRMDGWYAAVRRVLNKH